jgi:hypothetical protein
LAFVRSAPIAARKRSQCPLDVDRRRRLDVSTA